MHSTHLPQLMLWQAAQVHTLPPLALAWLLCAFICGLNVDSKMMHT